MFRNLFEVYNDKSLKISLNEDFVDVQNYKEIISFTDFLIIINCSSFNLIVKGSNLVLTKLLLDEVLIKGIIKSIEIDKHE